MAPNTNTWAVAPERQRRSGHECVPWFLGVSPSLDLSSDTSSFIPKETHAFEQVSSTTRLPDSTTRSLPSHRRPPPPHSRARKRTPRVTQHVQPVRRKQRTTQLQSDANKTSALAATTRATTSSAPTTAAPRRPNPSKSRARPTAALGATGTPRRPPTPDLPHTPARRTAVLAIYIPAGVAGGMELGEERMALRRSGQRRQIRAGSTVQRYLMNSRVSMMISMWAF